MSGLLEAQTCEGVLNASPSIGIEKRCSKCKGTKKICDFYSWSGNRCKDCINIWSRVYWKNHAAAASRHRKKYYTQNRDITLARHKEYYSRNPEAHRGRCQAWANANPERES